MNMLCVQASILSGRYSENIFTVRMSQTLVSSSYLSFSFQVDIRVSTRRAPPGRQPELMS